MVSVLSTDVIGEMHLPDPIRLVTIDLAIIDLRPVIIAMDS